MEHTSKQIALSGHIKLEVRLGVAISEFAQCLDEQQRQRFNVMREGSRYLSGADYIKVTEEINREGFRQHRKWRAITRVGGFLSRVQQLTSIGDVIIGGSQNLIATGVWSAIRLCLMVRQICSITVNLETLRLA